MAKVFPPPNRKKVPVRHSIRTGGNDAITDGRWWGLATEREQAAAAWSTLTQLNSVHGPRHFEDAKHVGLYENRPPYWAGAIDSQVRALVGSAIERNGTRIPLNLVKSVIDTAGAMISKNQAEIKAHTNGGSWRDQKRARQITKAIHGSFKLGGYHRHQARAFIDGCTSRARGCVMVYPDHQSGQVRYERVHPRTMLWNDLEGDDPRNLYRYFAVARETVMKTCGTTPEHKKAIEDAPQSTRPVNAAYRRPSGLITHADMVDVGMCWHKGYRGEKESGRRLMVIETKGGPHALINKPWPHDFFPFPSFCWDDADEGWGGKPLAEQLAPYQKEIREFLAIYRTGLKRAATSSGAWVEKNSETIKDEMTAGDPWSVRTYVGAPPVFSAPMAFAKEFFEFILWTYDKAFGEAGFSMLQAQGEKPEGVDAAIALREMSDITSTRQVPKGQRYERQSIEAGDVTMVFLRELFQNNPALVVRAPGTKFLEEITWKDIDMAEDMYVLDTSATSALPTHFVGKVQAVSDMIKSGLIPKPQAESGLGLRLLQMPDLERETDVSTSGREITNMQCDKALYDGVYIQPEPYQDPVLLLQTAQHTYLMARGMKDVPERNMRFLERLMAQANSLKQRSALNAAPPAVPGITSQPQLGAMPGQQSQLALPPMGGQPGAMPLPGPPIPGGVPPGPPQVIEQPVVPGLQSPPLPVPAVPSTNPAG